MIFISGGVRSGKSHFAESYITNLTGNYIYLATAKYEGSEMINRIQTHKNDRKDKGFNTIDKSSDITEIINLLDSNDIILLECLTTLVANEMFENNLSENEVVSKVVKDILSIKSKVKEIIVVSNDLYGDDIKYSKEVEAYYNAITTISIELIQHSNEVYELSYKIPIRRK